MRYNGLIDHEVVTDLTDEPVTLDELKRHLNMHFDTAGSYEFSDDDTILQDILIAARQHLEEYTGLSFGEKVIKAYIRNNLGEFEIPFGPIVSIESIKNEDGVTLTTDQYKLSPGKFQRIVRPYDDVLEVNYTVGYTTLPENLKRAILHEAAYRYNHRGDEDDSNGYCKSSLELASLYKRKPCLL